MFSELCNLTEQQVSLTSITVGCFVCKLHVLFWGFCFFMCNTMGEAFFLYWTNPLFHMHLITHTHTHTFIKTFTHSPLLRDHLLFSFSYLLLLAMGACWGTGEGVFLGEPPSDTAV